MHSSCRTVPSHRAAAIAPALAALLVAACGGTPAPATCDVPSTATIGATESWKLLGPDDWNPACTTLTVHAPALAANERLALVLVNAGGPDNATPAIGLAGTLAFAAADATPLARLASDPVVAPALAGEAPLQAALSVGRAQVVERRRAAMDGWLASQATRSSGTLEARSLAAAGCPAPPAVGSKRTFCVDKLTARTRVPEARPATLVHVSDNALFYVTDDVGPQVEALRVQQRPSMWTDFADAYEGTSVGTRNPGGAKRIRQALHESFGVETDYDASCRVIFLFANLTKYVGTSDGIIAGFFDPTDQQPADPACSGTGSNGADMLFLLDPVTFTSTGWSLSAVLDEQLPGTMAHELQHDVIFNARCRTSLLPSCGAIDEPSGDLWLNEGLSMVSEDFAGFGLRTPSERARMGKYLNCARTSSTLCYQDVSLTTWPSNEPGDANGHYGGVHAFLRWHLDQAGGGCLPDAAGGCALTRALVGSASGSRDAVAAATGLSFEEGFARFAAGALFSGEDPLFSSYPVLPKPAPEFSYAPAVPWSPLHATVGSVRYTTLPRPGGSAFVPSLRSDGWAAFVSGTGTGAEATLTVTSSAAVKPRAAIIRFKGSLPNP